MSAFITSQKTKQRIAELLYEDLFVNTRSRLFSDRKAEKYRNLLKAYNMIFGDGKTIEVDIISQIIVNSNGKIPHIQRIYNALDDLNTLAVNARYEERDEAEHLPITEILGNPYSPKTSKNLDCLYYQCSEDFDRKRYPELYAIYEMLDELRHALAYYLVRHSAEYEEEDWG